MWIVKKYTLAVYLLAIWYYYILIVVNFDCIAMVYLLDMVVFYRCAM